jgi:site-specific recombinase XerD
MQLSEAIEALCIATRALGRTPRTIQSYREKLGYLLRFLGDVPVEAITVADLRGYIAHMFDRDLSPFTVSTRGKAVRRLFNWLESEGSIDANPASKVEIPQPKRKEPKGPSCDEVMAILAACDGDSPADLRDKAAICLLFDSGARAGGVCGLEVDDVDLDRGLALVTEKGNKTRYVMFGPDTAKALRAWLDVRPEGSDAVFVALGGHRPGGPLTPNGLWQVVQRRAKKAGIKGPVSVHGFRHSFAREYLMGGGDLGALSQTLGHDDVRTTIDHYGIFAVRQLQELHRRFSPMARLFDEREGD